MSELPVPDWHNPDDAWRKAEHELDDDRRDRAAIAASDRRMEHRPHPKPAARVKRAEAQRPGIEWKWAVLERDQGCIYHANPAECSEGFYAHHVVSQQELRRSNPDALWNPLSGVGLCGKAHRQYHSGRVVVTQDKLPGAVTAYVRGLGLGWYLDRHYPQPEIEF